MAPSAVVADVEASRLRGRGGAAFPTGRKWRAVFEQPSDLKYVICNADEGDPGAFSDRILLEDDPHLVLEGLAIAAVAVGAERGYVYLRKEYQETRAAMDCAVAEARAAGVLGASLLGEGPAFDVEIVSGEGSYVCGEETALLNALEGRRPGGASPAAVPRGAGPVRPPDARQQRRDLGEPAVDPSPWWCRLRGDGHGREPRVRSWSR